MFLNKLFRRYATDDTFIVADDNILSVEGFLFEHSSFRQLQSTIYLILLFQYFLF